MWTLYFLRNKRLSNTGGSLITNMNRYLEEVSFLWFVAFIYTLQRLILHNHIHKEVLGLAVLYMDSDHFFWCYYFWKKSTGIDGQEMWIMIKDNGLNFILCYHPTWAAVFKQWELLQIYTSIERKWNFSESNIMTSVILLNPAAVYYNLHAFNYCFLNSTNEAY